MVRRLCALSAIAILSSLLFAAQSSATSYTVTVTLAGAGGGTVTDGGGTINCPGVCSEANYSSGAPLYLSAAPNAYSLFGGWTGGCASAGTSTTCLMPVMGDTSVGATFIAVPTGPLPATPHKQRCKKKKSKKKKHRAAAAAKKKKCKSRRR